ncbi:MAG: FAD binding domain-containing protein [Rhizobiaceae bacterium]|nr:FAD binding domain-containing protein [Rhizobiaceae bacterium]
MTLALQNFPSIEAATAALASPGARYLGGGTLVVRAANEGDVELRTFVRATDPRLNDITVSDGAVRLGASVTMASIARHPQLSAIAPAARAVGGPAIRNMATVGGNLFAPAPYGDFAVALLALDAKAEIDGSLIPLEDLLAGRATRYASSIVAGVSFGLPAQGSFRFAKVSRVKPKGISVLSIAATIEMAPDGTVKSARIALGCMADHPVRARAAEAALAGCRLDKEEVAPALALAAEGTSPITDPIASAWYRKEVLPVHLGRLLLS